MCYSTGFLSLCKGLKVVYDVSQPSGSRVASVEVLCADCEVPKYQPLQLNMTYGVVLPHTLTGGNEGYSMLVTYDPILLGMQCFFRFCNYNGFIFVSITSKIIFCILNQLFL